MEQILILLAVLVGLVAFSFGIAGLGYIPEVIDRLRGKPVRVRSPAEQLQIDVLRARGYTRRAAARLVDQIAELRNTEDFLASPMRETEARAVAQKLQADFQAGKLPPELARAYAEALATTMSAKAPR